MIFYIVVISLWVYLLAIFGVYYYKQFKQLPRKKFFSIKTLGIPIGTILVILIPIVLINLKGERYIETTEEYIEHSKEHKDGLKILKGQYQQLLDDSLNLDKHYAFVEHAARLRLDSELRKLDKWYELFTASDNSDIRDIPFLMKGFIDFHKDKIIDYRSSFDKVQNDSMPYLNYGYGLVFFQESNHSEAEKYFKKEIAIDGNKKVAAETLFLLYYDLDDTKAMRELAYNPETFPYLERWYKMDVYFEDSAWGPYFREALNRHYQIFNWFGFFGALLAALVWIRYLRSLDVFEPEKWRHIFLTFLLGTVFVLLVYPLSDMVSYYLGVHSGTSWSNLLIYSIVDVGMVEELVKILPWILILKFTNIMDEPFDYILYAALCGAGFAFTENLIYFKEVDLDIIFLRATYCIVGHMFWSSTIAYGYILYKYKHKGKRSKMYLIPVAFLLAALGHGLYDFFIFANLGFYSTFFFIASLHLFVVYQNSALNVSNHFSYQIQLNTRKIGVQLIFGLIAVFMYQYIVIGLRYGNDDANDMMYYSAMSVSFMLAYLTYTFTQIKISKGTWLKIAMPKWALQGKDMMEKFRLGNDYSATNSAPEDLTGVKIRFFAPKDNPYIGGQLPTTGVLIKRMEVSGSDDWYLVLLDSQLYLNNCLTDRVIIRHKNKGQSLMMDKVLIYFMMIPSEYEIQKSPLLTRDLLFTGRVYSRPV